jgi:hypothetical protein
VAPLLLPLALASALTWLDPSAVQPGQRGICITEWSGGARREIPLTVVGTLDATTPDRAIVLVRLEDPELAGSGVVAGMSGSPVYLDGKLLGAVAFGWTWAKQPLAGVTPFATMSAIPVGGGAVGGAAPTLAQLAAVTTGGVEPRAVLPSLPPRGASPPQLLAVAGLPIPGGFANELLAGMGLQPVPAGVGAEVAGPPEPGDMLAVPVVWGDATLASAGTVTARDGAKVWAFGHPMFGLGAVKLPANRARVLAIQGSYQTSFKFFAIGAPFGTLVADRPSGVVAEAGPVPAGTPVTVRVSDVTGVKTWNFRVADLPVLQPLLVTLLANACLVARGAAVGDASVRLDLVVHAGPDRQVEVRQAARGPDALARVSVFAGAVVGFLANSSFPHPPVSGVEIELVREEQATGAAIFEAVADRTTLAPGDEVAVEVRLQPHEQAPESRRIVVRVPPGTTPGPLDLIVADGASWSAYRVRVDGVDPTDFAGELDQVRRLESSTTIVAALEARDFGVALPGASEPGLPPSWSATLAIGLGRRSVVRLSTVVVAVERAGCPFPLEGAVRIPLTIQVRPEVP